MSKTIMEMTDEILNEALSQTVSEVAKDDSELPEISDDQRASMLNESLSEGEYGVSTGRSTTQTQGDREDVENKRRKAAGKPPVTFKSRSSDPRATHSNPNPAPQKRDARGMVIKDKPKGSTENASLYPRITLKKEELDVSKPHEPSEANAQARAALKAKSQQRRKVQSQAHSRYPRTNADSNSGPDSAHQRGRGKKAGEAGHVDTRSKGSSSGSNSSTWRKELSKAKDPAKHGTSQTIIPGKGGQKYARDAHAAALQRSRDQGKSGITKLQSANLSRKQHAVLREALSILREVTSVGGIGMGGSANKAYDADAKPMGKDTPPIKGVDASLKKMTKKGSKKVAKKTSKKSSKKEKEMENSSFSRFLNTVITETLGD